MLPALVLAAGASLRMGRPKLLLPLPGGHTFLSRIVRTLADAGFGEIVVVVREMATAAEALAASDVPVRVVVNPDPERGQLSSLWTGLEAIDRPGVDAALVTLVDVPLVSVATVRAVVDAWQRTRAPVVRPVAGERHGHPVVFGREAFSPLGAADPAVGAKPVLRAFGERAVHVAVDDPYAFEDADTPEAYASLLEKLGPVR